MNSSQNPLEIPFQLLNSSSELSTDEKNLVELADKACENAYAPHSGFRVGCALLLEDGSIVTGNNQENLAFPSGLCAERVALFAAGAAGNGGKIRKIGVRARSKTQNINVPVTPCGACRQVMLEYERMGGTKFIVLMQGMEGPVLRLNGVGDCLLPFGFNIDL